MEGALQSSSSASRLPILSLSLSLCAAHKNIRDQNRVNFNPNKT